MSSDNNSSSKGSQPSTNEAEEEIIIYAMPGSQYSGKVLAALDSRNIPHRCKFVAFDPTKRNLPSGQTKVPEMTVRIGSHSDDNNKEGGNQQLQIVPDSEKILDWFDEFRHTQFFPNAFAKELSERASNQVLSGSALYYNWVHPDGYARSMRCSIQKAMIPSWIPSFLSATIVDWFVLSFGGYREKFQLESAKQLGLATPDSSDPNMDETQIRSLLIEELLFFQSHLQKTNTYLLPGNQPSAPDFSVYVMVERLVGDMGDANVSPSYPTLIEETSNQLERFWQWHQMMRQRHPIKFKGKRCKLGCANTSD